MRRLGLVAALAAATAIIGMTGASAATTAGTWSLTPALTTEYQAAVQQPINADGTSSWPAKKGVIAVQFKMASRSSFVFASMHTGAPVYSAAVLTPSTAMTFADVQSLVANYAFTTGDCFGGSLRWTIDVQHNGTENQIYAYYGDPGGVQSCSGAASGSGQNLITTGPDNRFELQGRGPGGSGSWGDTGPVYTTYTDALAHAGSDHVNWVGLILDSGWHADQVVTLTDATVNDNTWTAPVTSSTFAPTCTLPAARIAVQKMGDANPTPPDETLSASSADTTGLFRQVDCKYIYNLAVASLSGVGRYSVNVNIDGVNVANPGTFGLR
jgi:hypothetical protein